MYEKARQQSGTPKQGPWTNHALKIFIANRENEDTPEADPKSEDPDGLCKAIALVRQGDIKACVNTTQVYDTPTQPPTQLLYPSLIDRAILWQLTLQRGACIL